MKTPSIPVATYRLQFNKDFTFSHATEWVPYLAALGISHCYASPYLRARPGSMHGYDIIDHHHLNPEIGTPQDYQRFVAALHEHGMQQILDIVPNHMGIMGSDNAWWLDVLENGESSVYAEYFDIDWEPLKDELQGKVLVPVLGDQYGIVLDRGELKLAFDKQHGEFSISYFQHRFPVNPREYPSILRCGLEDLKQRLGPENQDVLELQSLIAAFHNLPGRKRISPEKRTERQREKEIYKAKLAAFCERSAAIMQFIEEAVRKINGSPGDSSSFDSLHELIKAQSYRLAYWRVAADDINYRRFFDVNDLAALRQENELVFEATHEFILRLLQEGTINGLRIDHPDGLYDPQQYFRRLQRHGGSPRRARLKPNYVVAEKILTGDEKLPADWPIYGTTGYNFSNLVNALFIDQKAETEMDRIYTEFVGQSVKFDRIVYECKKLVIDHLLNSELNVLGNHLSRIALAERHTCDFTLKSLRDALAEIVACFPVYRTYISSGHVSESDRKYIEEAVECAKGKSTGADSSVYDFIREVLLTRIAKGRPLYYQNSVLHFAMRFQQYTSALMAKGLEDTSFYRYNRLISLNDVGGDPLRFGIEADEFHQHIEARAKFWPHEMLATSTHDSKRSEDVRARIDVLSEMTVEWERQLKNWRELNRDKKTLCQGNESPSLNDEYHFYQTLIGAWPVSSGLEPPEDSFLPRVRDYMLKAVREAKDESSWRNPNVDYESALASFVDAVLQSADFREQFVPFQRKIAFFGLLNSLSQSLIKLTAPGVPDIYQGNELWQFSLVDPDNRRTVDYATRHKLLMEIQALGSQCCEKLRAAVRELAGNIEDCRIKMYILWKTLSLRNREANLFRHGEYLPLQIVGPKSKHIVAFARREKNRIAITAVPRLLAELLNGNPGLPLGSEIWHDTQIELPARTPQRLQNVFTGEHSEPQASSGAHVLYAKQLFNEFPVALLNSVAA
ncbi:MAG: malto-oligosyltrehalose synthase [Acidobacteriaceae bacterium]|nr:malto-oligosyltrehalose synthase [Acidobacteriaceae bacterium]